MCPPALIEVPLFPYMCSGGRSIFGTNASLVHFRATPGQFINHVLNMCWWYTPCSNGVLSAWELRSS